jgi:hypothetical protein
MRAERALPACRISVRSPPVDISLNWLLPVDSRAIVAMLPFALDAAWAAVPFGVLNFEGCCHLRSDLWPASRLTTHDPPRARSHPNSALSHTSQKSNPSFKS